MTRSTLVFIVSLMTVTTACNRRAPTPARYTKWLNEDVVYIINDRLRAEFLSLKTDEQRDKFIDQFWRVCEPPPGVLQRNLKAEHYRRLAFANAHFGTTSGTPGWKTDRGRSYILWGPPDEISSYPHGDKDSVFPYEWWRYRHIDGMGEGIEGIDDDFLEFRFTDLARNGEYRLTYDPRWYHDRYWNPLVTRVRVAPANQERNLITKVDPIYPPEAMTSHVQGRVRLTVEIGKDGRVFNIRLVSGDPRLVMAASDAVRQWVYKPNLVNGYPLEVVTEVDVNFSLPAK